MRLVLAVMLFAGLATTAARAADLSSLYPQVPKATGEPHPEGNEFMRINHMLLMTHDRDDTVRLGDREIKYSLKECVTCHAVKGEDAEPVAVSDEKHFCRVCHDYVAVKVDCFQCHNSKPEITTETMLLEREPDFGRLAAYIREASQ